VKQAAASKVSSDHAAMLAEVEERTFGYFERERNPGNGLIKDNTRELAPASIAGCGLALASYVVAAYRGYLSRNVAADRVVTSLRFFHSAPQDDSPVATGYHGFFYHFLDAATGRRVWKSELSTIDTAIVIAGALVARAFFDRAEEIEIRELAEQIYARVEWSSMVSPSGALYHGWKPETGYLRYEWRGYNEALFLYILALGSRSDPIPESAYGQWTSTYRWTRLYDHEFLFGGPLFMHQLSHIWIDFRGIQDDYMRGKAIDYFENSRRATVLQREYAIRNPRGFRGYGPDTWGITASDGPGPATKVVGSRRRRFYAYKGRGLPPSLDDGTLAPWGVTASLPFAPDIVVSALEHMAVTYPSITGKYGYKCSFNPTFSSRKSGGWISQGFYAIDQGPAVLMIENYRSGLLWRLLRECDFMVEGLRRAGFRGGWLGGTPRSDSDGQLVLTED
jgi:hypothetical protein